MASAAITVTEQPATIESDTTEALITKDTHLPDMEGTLTNGATATFLKVSVVGAASGVATTSAQAQLQFPLKVNQVFEWLPHYVSVAHKTAGGTTVLAWNPKRRID